ncbi:MAG TPA: rod shape-determining protein MreD [Candidatus Marinimicrobia bacterium]|nr:rod shape-determining protein MreD [Candidatus Neomarinimicrobiota bacterium]HRS51375.1 rod shape-determining protein MreD [Candidatus Neomarinimicrobiota bacterium]HRU92253.1 rod shape-determining protein MreD [Candidatus Neomarinimicrobiota bacterium]
MLRKILLIIAFSLVAIIIQILFGPWLTIRAIRPDFLLILVLLVGRSEGKVVGQIYGFIIGLIADAIGLGSFLGLSALAKTIAGFGSGSLKKRRSRLNPILFYGIEVLIILIHFSIIYLINFKGVEITTQAIILQYILPSALYTGIFYFVIQYFVPLSLE